MLWRSEREGYFKPKTPSFVFTQLTSLRTKAVNRSVQNLVHLQEQQQDGTELQKEFDLKTGDEKKISLAQKRRKPYGIHKTLSTRANLHLPGHFGSCSPSQCEECNQMQTPPDFTVVLNSRAGAVLLIQYAK